MGQRRPIGQAIITCPACREAMTVSVDLDQVSLDSGYLNLRVSVPAVEHECKVQR